MSLHAAAGKGLRVLIVATRPRAMLAFGALKVVPKRFIGGGRGEL
jgi:hypothetical protein